jgi:hypothetical protein
MKKQSKNSSVLIGASTLCFVAGGLSFLAVKSVAVAAGLTAIGGAMLVANAVLHPEGIKIPDVKIPDINIPSVNIE